jgi:hypothetical protein
MSHHEDSEHTIPRFEYIEGTPRVEQVLRRVNDHHLVYFGKEHKCSPRKLVLHVLRHLTEPYGYRWNIVPENRYAFDIIDCAWTHADGKFFPMIGRVFVNPLQRGIEGGVQLSFYPKFLLHQDSKGFLERVESAFDEERTKFAMWEETNGWLPMVRAKEDEPDHSLRVEIYDETPGFEDNLTRILVNHLRRMRSTWILVQSFSKRMPKIDTDRHAYPLVKQDVARLLAPVRK